MPVRTEIQKRVTELVEAGTFPKVVYANKIPSETTALSPESVICNETGGALSDSPATGATSVGFVLTNWRFECVAEFNSEVDVSYFMLNELRGLNFSVDNMLVSIVPSGDFKVTHPPRNASHNGTKLMIGLTANTRR